MKEWPRGEKEESQSQDWGLWGIRVQGPGTCRERGKDRMSRVPGKKAPLVGGRPGPGVVVFQLTGLIREINLHSSVATLGDKSGESFSLTGIRGPAFNIQVITRDEEIERRRNSW